MTERAALFDSLEMFLGLEGPLLIATDFDGVLAPLRDDPTLSRPLPLSAQALSRLTGARDGQIVVAYVSGRKIDELFAFTQPLPGTFLFGTHGSQAGWVNETGDLVVKQVSVDPERADVLAAAREKATELAATARGAWVEHKDTSVVLHTRLASEADSRRIESEFRSCVAALDLHVILGHDVTEVSATDATKGIVVSQLRNELGAKAVLYFGDDVTDETVFSVLNAPDIGVKVGKGDTLASHRVGSPEDVAFTLSRIADMVSKDL